MLNKLKGWITDNTVTKDPNDKILLLDPAGKVGLDKIYEEMRAEDTGLRQETLVHVVSLYERVVARLLMNGYQVNTGLFYAVPRFTGVLVSGQWNPASNSIYVSFTQDKVLREEIAKTQVEILAEKPDVMYIIDVEDRSTNLKNGTITPGRNMAVHGAYLRVQGSDASVGISFKNMETSVVTKVNADMFGQNDPSVLLFIVPAELTAGTYELTVTTQYMRNKTDLKTPRSATTLVSIPGGGNDDDKPDSI